MNRSMVANFSDGNLVRRTTFFISARILLAMNRSRIANCQTAT